jgi:hypothetical protein
VIRHPGTIQKISYTGSYTTEVIGSFLYYYLTSSGTITVSTNL